jgi:DNA polymerase-3 subunit epsilon
VHGLSIEFLTGKPEFHEIAVEFLAFIGEARLVIHNAEFDMRFINAELARAGHEAIGNERVLDTLAVARRKFPGASNSLDALADRFGVDRTRRDKHGALVDSLILSEIYLELSGGRQTSLLLAPGVGKGRPARGTGSEAVPVAPLALPSRLSEAEGALHAAFVATLGQDAIWNDYA